MNMENPKSVEESKITAVLLNEDGTDGKTVVTQRGSEYEIYDGKKGCLVTDENNPELDWGYSRIAKWNQTKNRWEIRADE